jgi:hypothetical protein
MSIGSQLLMGTMKTKELKLNGDGSKPWYLVNPKIAGKWMFIPLKMYLYYRYCPNTKSDQKILNPS